MVDDPPEVRGFRWKRIDISGSETALLRQVPEGWALSGEVSVQHEAGPIELSYSILCDSAWRTQFVRVERRHGGRNLERTFAVLDGRWSSGIRTELPDLRGCLDVDLGFTPATNALPIRRSHLEVGQSATVSAAWLSFPELEIERLDQVYVRTGERSYRYESDGGRFVRTLTVDHDGFVIEYPGQWTREESR